MPGDRAFYPLHEDIRNHVSKARKALELSKFDQQNLQLKIEEWKASNSDSLFFFRPYKCNPDAEGTSSISNEGDEVLLYVCSTGKLADKPIGSIWEYSNFDGCYIQNY